MRISDWSSDVCSSDLEAWLVQMIFAMARIGATLVSAPILSALGVPLQVRVILAGAVGLLVLGLYPLEVPADPLSLPGFATFAQEAPIGLSVGFILQVAFAADWTSTRLTSRHQYAHSM